MALIQEETIFEFKGQKIKVTDSIPDLPEKELIRRRRIMADNLYNIFYEIQKQKDSE